MPTAVEEDVHEDHTEDLTTPDLTEAQPTTPLSTNSSPAPTSSNAAAAPPAPPSPDIETDEEDDETDPDDHSAAFERDHPSFNKSTISVFFQLLPDDGHTDGRLAILAVRSHNLTADTKMLRTHALGPLPNQLTTMLTEWEHQLPNRLQARTEQRAKKRAEEKAKEAERKSKSAASRKPEPKKADKPKSTTSPAVSSGPVQSTHAEPQVQLF